jgi:hypothetical protein
VEVTLNIERLKRSAVAASIAGQAKLIEPRVTLAMDGDIAHVYLLPPRPLDPFGETKVTLKLREVPAWLAWARLVRGSEVTTSLPKETQHLEVTLDEENQPRRLVIYHLIRQLSARVSNLWISDRDWKVRRFEPLPPREP